MGIFIKKYWNSRYQTETLPWVTHRSDINLQKTIESYKIAAGRVLELGCGYGDNAIWLAKKGFTVTALDISEEAIKKAEEKATGEGVKCRFLVRDFIMDRLDQNSFDFVFDRGCFHSHNFKRKRKVFAREVSSCLKNEGLWLSIIGSRDTKDIGEGPPKLSATEIAKGVEGYFKILQLKAVVFDSDQKESKKAWCCLMQKRHKL